MSRSIVIAAVQANPTVGAIAANEALARQKLAEARAAGADLAVFPELFINGYPPEDLALKPAFWRAGQEAVERLSLETDDSFAALIGVIWPAAGPGRRPRNGLAFLAGGKVQGVAFFRDAVDRLVRDRKLSRPAAIEAVSQAVDAGRQEGLQKIKDGGGLQPRSHWNVARSVCLDVNDAYKTVRYR